MILDRLSFEAQAAADRYEALTEAFRSVFARALMDPDFGSARQIGRVSEDASRIGGLFLEREMRHIEELTPEIASEAHTATLREIRSIASHEVSDAVSELVIETDDYLYAEISAQVTRDIAMLARSLRIAALEVTTAARATGISNKRALAQRQIGNGRSIEFFFHDRGARKWKSRSFVRSVFRHATLNLYNEVVLMTAADHGLRRTQVRHVDPKSSVHAMIVAMAPNTEHLTYSEIRDEVFHPNANAVLCCEAN